LVRTGLILFLLISSFLVGLRPVSSQSQFCGSHTGDLYDLPACAIYFGDLGIYPGVPIRLADSAYLTSVEPQTVIAQPGENLSFVIDYQIWLTPNGTALKGNPCNCPYQLVFVGSWPMTPQLYWLVYSGFPPLGLPGIKGTASFHLTAPIEPGTYYLWIGLDYALGSYGNDERSYVTSIYKDLRPPAHIKIIVSTNTLTKTVTAIIPGAVVQSSLTIPVIATGVTGIVVAVIGCVVAARRGKLRFRRGDTKLGTPSKPTISTGYSDLDGTLEGGIPEGYAVVLVSPSYDERDLLLRKIIDSAISSGRPAFYISADIERTQDLLARYPHGFYAFSPQADKIASNANLYKIPYLLENLSEANISLTLAIKQARAKEQATKMIVVIDILSDLLVRYKGITTRKWLSDFVGKRKVEGFTILATLNPLVGDKQDSQMVIDFFDGVIEIFEKELRERSRRFVVVKKMYGRKYSESELMLDKDKLF